MFVLSSRSFSRLEGVDKQLVLTVENAIQHTGVDFGVICGLRTVEEQKELFDSGASQTMGRGGYYSSSQGEFVVDVPVIMRSNPTLDYVSGTDYYVFYRNGGSDTINTLALNSESQVNQIHILNNAQSSGTAAQCEG